MVKIKSSKKNSFLYVVVIASLINCEPSLAAFKDMTWGTRAAGLAGTFSALADDSSAPMYNPAGIAQIEWNEFSLMYARLYAGLKLFSGDNTTDLAISNASYVPAKTSEKKLRTAYTWSNFTSAGLYREDTLTYTIAQNINNYLPDLPVTILAGINLKYMRHSFTLDSRIDTDPVFRNQRDKNALSTDAGILLNPNLQAAPGLGIALVAQNINEPDLGISSRDKVPKTIRVGLAYADDGIPYFVPALEYTLREGVSKFSGGVESWLLNQKLGLRAGASSTEAAFGLSYYFQIHEKNGIRLDYALMWPFLIEDSGGSHRLSLTIYF